MEIWNVPSLLNLRGWPKSGASGLCHVRGKAAAKGKPIRMPALNTIGSIMNWRAVLPWSDGLSLGRSSTYCSYK